MRILLASIVFVVVILLVGVVATLIAKAVGGGPALSFLLGMAGGPLASIAGFAVYMRGSDA